jgi:hypothetical protein
MIVPQICNSTHSYENRFINWISALYVFLAYFLCSLAEVDFLDHRVVYVGVSVWTFKNLTDFHETSCESYDFGIQHSAILLTVVCVCMPIWTYEKIDQLPWTFVWMFVFGLHQSSIILIVACVAMSISTSEEIDRFPWNFVWKLWLWNPPLLIS